MRTTFSPYCYILVAGITNYAVTELHNEMFNDTALRQLPPVAVIGAEANHQRLWHL